MQLNYEKSLKGYTELVHTLFQRCYSIKRLYLVMNMRKYSPYVSLQFFCQSELINPSIVYENISALIHISVVLFEEIKKPLHGLFQYWIYSQTILLTLLLSVTFVIIWINFYAPLGVRNLVFYCKLYLTSFMWTRRFFIYQSPPSRLIEFLGPGHKYIRTAWRQNTGHCSMP